jgi:hypothetical protein
MASPYINYEALCADIKANQKTILALLVLFCCCVWSCVSSFVFGRKQVCDYITQGSTGATELFDDGTVKRKKRVTN